MRVVYTILLFFLATSLLAQETLITKTKIPWGVQVRHIETDSLIDISKLHEGLDELGVPKNLIIPADTWVSLFLPQAVKDDDVSYWTLNTGTYTSVVTGEDNKSVENDRLVLKYKYDFDYQENKVLLLLDNELASKAHIEYYLLKMTFLPDGRKIYSDTTHISFRAEITPAKIREIYLGKEIIEHMVKLEQRSEIRRLFRSNGISSVQRLFPNRTYEKWIEAGYSSGPDSTLLPIKPVLPYDVNALYFNFTSWLSLKNIRLEHNGSSIPVTRDMMLPNSILALENLKSGHYTIIIDNSNSKYSNSPSVYEFTIRSSFWNQGGYWLAILLPLFLILFFSYRTYVKARLHRLDLVKQLTEAELRAIRAQLNPHFLFNALNAIQNQVNQQNTEQANAYIAKLSKLMRLVLNQSEDTFQSLQLELEVAELYLELEKLRSPFDYSINVPEAVNLEMLVPTMLLQPYLENAVIHGVNVGSATKIQLDIAQQGDLCEFRITDNGDGKSASSGNKKSMKMSAERLRVLEQQHDISTTVSAEPTNNGYEVVIQIPTDL